MLQWTPDLATGSSEIDAEHKIFFQRCNEFMDACVNSDGREETSRFLKFLKGHAVYHFADEEHYMMEHNYPHYAEHKKQHEAFVWMITEIDKAVESDGPTLGATLHAIRVILEWIRNHIMVCDKKLAQFMETRECR